ncbi:MAG: G8 domain-containing protein [Devosia sp.]|uniref:G8 domain-containing protein n=1 Tax=Devosia sp. TaxID=1871048 RepID=UPI003392ACB7
MRMRARLLPFALLLAAGLGARANAQEAHADHANMAMPAAAAASGVKQSRWSDPASWPSGKVPGAGDAVTIGRDRNIVLDVSPPALRSLTINGRLSFSNERDLDLTSEWILVGGGELDIGSAARPYTRKATITLTDTVPNEDINTMGDRGIMMLAGTLNLHGDRSNSWTKLAKTAKAGSAKIEVLNAAGWRKGDQIVLASTDFDPHQAEERTVTAISGNALTLDKPLKYMHFGEVTYGVDERGEVGLLTRNIKIQASADAEKSYFGGHIMAMAGSKMYVSGVELNRMGQNMHLARYPIHWHIGGEGQGQYIRNSSIHDTYSRCVTVHGTNNLRVENNVTFNTVGHCYFLEDAVETGNQFIRNLGILTKCHPDGKPCVPTNLTLAHQSTVGQKAKDILIPSDNTASTFWITNPDNNYRDNVAAGSEAIGFWIALPQHPTGAFLDSPNSKAIWPRRTPVREFKGNTAHSNFDGLMFDRGPAPDGTFTVGGAGHIAYADPGDPKSKLLVSTIDTYTGYKNRNGAIWGRGEAHLFKNLALADNAIGFTHAAGGAGLAPYTTQVVDSLFVGESGNIGNPTTKAEIAYGRSLPHQDADFPIRGYEYYDYRHEIVNTTFVNYQPNATREAGAISYLLFTSFGMSTENSVKGLKFVNSKPVDFPGIQRRWASDFGGRAAYRSAAFHDLDGSVGGVSGAYIVIDNGIASDEKSCEIKASWGAAICKGDMGRLSIGNTREFPEFAVGSATDPVVLQRDGKRYEYNGETTIPNGAEIRVATAKTKLSLNLREMDKGSWVIFELPGFTNAAAGEAASSLAALRESGKTVFFKDKDSLWVKLVVEDPAPSGPVVVQVGNLRAQASLEVSKAVQLSLAK